MFRSLKDFFAPVSIGRRGEDLAAGWLRRERRFAIIARNWRSPRDLRCEIDLVAQDGEILVFVEVKARAMGAAVRGYYAVNRRKRAALRRAIFAYLALLRTRPQTVRFDVVEVGISDDGERDEVRHFENVPLFRGR